jgi:hypothetical protein
VRGVADSFLNTNTDFLFFQNIEVDSKALREKKEHRPGDRMKKRKEESNKKRGYVKGIRLEVIHSWLGSAARCELLRILTS